MANCCYNDIYIQGPKEKVNNLWKKFFLKNDGTEIVPFSNEIDESHETEYKHAILQALRPIPPEITPVDLREWKWGNWGTSGASYDAALEYKEMSDDSAVIKGIFCTRWGGPVDACLYFSRQNPDVILHLFYQDEFEEFVGCVKINYGVIEKNISYIICDMDDEAIAKELDPELEDFFGILYRREIFKVVEKDLLE